VNTKTISCNEKDFKHILSAAVLGLVTISGGETPAADYLESVANFLHLVLIMNVCLYDGVRVLYLPVLFLRNSLKCTFLID